MTIGPREIAPPFRPIPLGCPVRRTQVLDIY